MPGLGSGFRFCRLGKTLFDEHGEINKDVPFTDLARYVYLIETGVPVPTKPRKDHPLLGVHGGRAIYLLYNGVLGDKRPAGGNVLTHAVLEGVRSGNTMFTQQSWFATMRWVRRLGIGLDRRPSTRPAGIDSVRSAAWG